MEAGEAIADHRQRQVEERGGLDQANTPAEIEVNDRRLDGRLVRTVDQVEAVGDLAAQAPLDPVDGALDGLDRQPGGPEDAEHSPPPHRLDDLDRADAVGHRARHARVAGSVESAELWITQLIGCAGGHEGEKPFDRFVTGRPRVTRSDVPDPVPGKHQERRAQSTKRLFELLLQKVGRVHLHLAAPRCSTGGKRRNPSLAHLRASVRRRL